MAIIKSSWILLSLTLLIVMVLCNPLPKESDSKVSYDDLEALGTTCYPLDTCERNETKFNYYNCDCDDSCLVYDTCCVDSPFRIHADSIKRKSNLECLEVHNSPGFKIFMVDSCKSDEDFDNLCTSDPEDSNDPFLMVPVTSNVTGITYKNYFCAVCNEDTDSTLLEFWDLQTWGQEFLLKNLSDPQFKFNKTIRSWTLHNGKSNGTSHAVPVTLSIQKSPRATVKYCSIGLIESCSRNWTDNAVANKCKYYMAIVNVFPNIRYRNPHCALCNFEKLNNLHCTNGFFGVIPVGGAPAAFGPASGPSIAVDVPLIGLFVLEDRKKRCGKSMVYDKFTNKCRCNSRIHRKENGKCVHKI